MAKVVILTTFTGWDPMYSLIAVAETQIKMLTRNGYEVAVIVGETFKPEGAYALAELRHIKNVPCHNEVKIDETFADDVNVLRQQFTEHLQDARVVLTHDLIYQPAALKHNVAARQVAEAMPKIRWLHWVHSATPFNLLSGTEAYRDIIGRKFPHSFVVYPNPGDIPRVAKNFGYEEDEVKWVPHSVDLFAEYKMEPLTIQLLDEVGAIHAEAIGVYPLRLDRGKQVEFVIRTFAQLKRVGRSVALFICDFHSTGGDKVIYRNEMIGLAKSLGLIVGKEVIFTSQWEVGLPPEERARLEKLVEEARDREGISDQEQQRIDDARRSLKDHPKKPFWLGCPHEVVIDLYKLANVFMLPSKSETYSLVAQEAAIHGCFVILNRDFPPMRSIYGDKHVVYKQFSGGVAFDGYDGEITTKYDNVDAYCYDIAMRIAYELENNCVLGLQAKLRRERNPDTVFQRHLEPLLYYEE